MDGNALGNSKGTKGGMYRPDGTVQGDDAHQMSNAGYSTGVTDSYGVNLSGSALNRMGAMGSCTDSDPMMDNMPDDPTFSEGQDEAEKAGNRIQLP